MKDECRVVSPKDIVGIILFLHVTTTPSKNDACYKVPLLKSSCNLSWHDELIVQMKMNNRYVHVMLGISFLDKVVWY